MGDYSLREHALEAQNARLHFELMERFNGTASKKPPLSLRDPNGDRFTIPATSMPKDTHDAGGYICKACENITLEIMRAREGYLHSADIGDLIKSAEECPICNLIQQAVSASSSDLVQRGTRHTNVRAVIDAYARKTAQKEGICISRPTPIVLFLTESDELGRLGFSQVMIGTAAFTLNPPRKVFGLPLGVLMLHGDSWDGPQPILPRGSEQEVLSRLAAWLRQRQSEVPSWSTQADEKPLPTRILDLGDPSDSDAEDYSPKTRLIETSGKLGHYVALSYAWGGYKACRTLRSNYEDMLLGIEFESLPAVFQQAIKVTKGLGLRYLWIDAICIIQEDADDWSREASLMAATYWNSAIRLAISDCQNPTEDFFPPKQIPSVKLSHLKAPEPRVGWEGISERGRSVSDQEEFRRKWKQLKTQNIPVSIQSEGIGGRSALLRPGGGGEGSKGTNHFVRDGNSIRRLGDQRPYSATHGDTLPKASSSDQNEELSAEISTETGGKTGDADTETLRHINDIQDRAWAFLEEHWQKSECSQARPSRHSYLTFSPSYSSDINMASLNSRGWVLQERLLAPRTIHFTKYHIYCEDSDDICGEDWVRQKFIWMSCIVKPANRAQVELFPSRKFGSSVYTERHLGSEEISIWAQRSLYTRESVPRVEYPWLKIAEAFSKCQLSYQTDRLAAIAGLVIQKQSDVDDIYVDDRNFCGMWEKTLHIELGWVSAGKGSLEYVRELKFPSWAWISYRGTIAFAKDQTSTSSESRTPPLHTRAFELIEAEAPELTTTKPLTTPASLTLKTRLRKVHAVSLSPTSYGLEQLPREELKQVSPFHFDPRTDSMPIPLSHWSTCREMVTSRKRVIGFVSLDDDILVAEELFCAHVSTLTDEATSDAQKKACETRESIDLGAYRVPVLAYALVVVKVSKSEDVCEFRRVGFAEVNYHWMINGVETVLKVL